MTEYEVLMESVNPCGGDRHSVKSIFEVESDDPEAYVRENGQFPILEIGHNQSGDLVITTGDGKGYKVTYTFTE